MKKIVFLITFSLFFGKLTYAQFVFPKNIERVHPRLISSKVSKEDILQKIETSNDVQQSYKAIKSKISKYVEQYKTEPEWLSSRYQMYWKSHATDIFVKGEFYDHAKGYAPVPTVRFTGQRDYVTDYKMPSLKDAKPYLEDSRGLFLQNKKTDKWEWVNPAKTGRIIENTNENIMRIARDAALVYYVEGDADYAKLAAHLFDVYMQGLYYRNEPIDMKKGNVQNIIGLTSFQVIKENIVDELAECYDFLYDYIQKKHKKENQIYATSLKKLAEIIIKNGVADNNWNLHQANFVIQIALVLDEDKMYDDGKGCQYYLNRVFNESEVRQWSVKDVLDYGYDQKNGVWNESSSYALSVAEGYTHLARVVQNSLGVDVMQFMPVIPEAVAVMPQYLYPNNNIVAFGDSHYGPLKSNPYYDLISNAQQFNNREQEEKFTGLLYLIEGEKVQNTKGNKKNAFSNFLHDSTVLLDETIAPAIKSDYMTSSFYAPTVSWVAMRNGLDAKHGLMISQVGSLGNHAHSNGIAMELYGKNYVLAPEGGRGSSYFQPDYREYYSQFPAHNTVSVNGKSQYNKMRSYYPFQVNALYPTSERKSGYYPNINFSDVYFNEPSTNSDQNRVMSIVRTGETSGYYVDIFRSKQKDGKDGYHDYFYHNLGQELNISTKNNQTLKLDTSSKLTSKAGNIKAYDYITDETSVKTDSDFNAIFNLSIKGEEKVSMNMWMSGNKNREIFKVKSLRSEAMREAMVPEEIAKALQPTIVVRQTGEAWNRPFVAVYEPSTTSEPSRIKHIETFDAASNKSFVGLKIESLSDRIDYVFSSDTFGTYGFQNIRFDGAFGVVTTEKGKITLFLGSGKRLEENGYNIEILGKKYGTATLVYGEQMQLTCDDPILLTVPDVYGKGNVVMSFGFKQLNGDRHIVNGKKLITFKVPPMPFQDIVIGLK
ncbi:heparinase II/III family protein [Algibacter sp. L4_22]|uniref:heparinase II/III domain-containing protein n=1 Tax=Algibacter sp. L4_22 TaxID=2942477 RepID=UPI00201B9616|nr:heparinase II/III family protein [Algibacter sp. L4_22]MCL5128544.1 heparinase II/III family protein [Algibacter sp. L4_22]